MGVDSGVYAESSGGQGCDRLSDTQSPDGRSRIDSQPLFSLDLAVGFVVCDYLEAAGVSSLFIFSAQPHINDTTHQLFAEQVCGQAKDVGIVMAAGQFSRQLVMAKSRADAADFDGGDRLLPG